MLMDNHYISRLKITLIVIRMVNKSFEDAVRCSMFKRDIGGKKTRKLILEVTCNFSVRNVSSSRLASTRTALGAEPVFSTGGTGPVPVTDPRSAWYQ